MKQSHRSTRRREAPTRPAPLVRRMRRALFVAIALCVWPGSAAWALPLISEVYYDAVGSDDGQVFVELAGSPGASVDGLVLTGINGSNGAAGPTLVLEGVFGDDGLFVVADRTSAGETFVDGWDQLLNFDFQNGPDSIVLEDGLGVLDAVGYGEFDPDEVFAGEGSAAPDPPAGSSLARLFADVDLDDNATDFVVEATPTPGSAQFAAVPEPGAGVLAGAGLFVLGRLRRGGRSRTPRIGSRRG